MTQLILATKVPPSLEFHCCLSANATAVVCLDGCPKNSYSCNDFAHGSANKCYFKHDRCSGSSVCANYADEENCGESWDAILFMLARSQSHFPCFCRPVYLGPPEYTLVQTWTASSKSSQCVYTWCTQIHSAVSLYCLCIKNRIKFLVRPSADITLKKRRGEEGDWIVCKEKYCLL